MWSPNNNSRKQKDDSFKRREYWKFDEVSSKMREPVITLYAKKVVAHAATNGRSCCQVFVKELVDGAAAIAGLADTASPAPTTTSSMVLEASGAARNDTPAAAPTMVVRGPLRSGQRVYARQSDLIVMGVVSRGAEVIADGNIHVYGPLRGKAMAGARGDTAARIFTTSLDAELVAVAGIYRVIDSKLPAELHQRPAVIQLQKDALHLTPLEK